MKNGFWYVVAIGFFRLIVQYWSVLSADITPKTLGELLDSPPSIRSRCRNFSLLVLFLFHFFFQHFLALFFFFSSTEFRNNHCLIYFTVLLRNPPSVVDSFARAFSFFIFFCIKKHEKLREEPTVTLRSNLMLVIL